MAKADKYSHVSTLAQVNEDMGCFSLAYRDSRTLRTTQTT